jgi:hypothetical protein
MKYFLGWFLAFAISTSALAQNAPSKFFFAFAAYEREVQLYEDGKSKLTLEELYDRANAIWPLWSKDIADVLSANTSQAGVLDTRRFDLQIKPYDDLVEKKSERFVFRYQEQEFALPVLPIYGKFAQQRGNLADKAFFTLMQGLYGRIKVWRSYENPVTDYSSCINFGTNELSKQHGVWNDYKSKYPHFYRHDVEEGISHIEDALAAGTCVCGDQQSFQSELKFFIKTYPQSKLTPLLAHRLASPKHAPPKGLTSPMRFNCSPG